MPPYLSDGDPGSLTITLAGDPLLGGSAAASFGTVRVRNPRNVLAGQQLLTSAGREWVVRAGLTGWSRHRWFEVLYCSILEGEPSFETDGMMTFGLQAALRQLAPNLRVRRYVGIQTGVALYGTAATNGYVAAYDLTTFAVAGRFILSGTPSLDAGLLDRSSSITAEHFNLYLEAGIGKVVARSSVGGVGAAVLLRSPLGYADGQAHWALYGVDGARAAYLVVDGAVVARGVPAGLVDLPVAGLRVGRQVAGATLFDLRLYGSCPDPYGEVQSLMAQRSDLTESAIVFMGRCDDGAGGVITDYGANANRVTITGTLGVDYSWVPTDLGEAAQAGQVMPLTLGTASGVTAQRIDNNRERYRLTDGPDNSAANGQQIGAVLRQRGAVTNTVGAANGLTNGVYEFGAAASQPVTFERGPDTSIGSTFREFSYAGNVAEDLMLRWMGLTEFDYDPYSVDQLRALAPWETGLAYSAEVAGSQALLDALAWGGHTRLDAHGRVALGYLQPTITPGPYPGEACLEFCGNKGAGVALPIASPWGVPFTLCFWVKSLGQPTPSTLGGIYPDGFPAVLQTDTSAGFWAGISSLSGSQLLFATFNQSPPYTLSPPGTAPWAQWTFCMLVHRASGGTTYRELYAAVKGQPLALVASGSSPASSYHAATASMLLEIGGQVSTGKSIAGSVGHVQVYNSALTVAQGQALMFSHPTGPGGGLLSYAPLNEGSGPYVYDVISGARARIRGGRWAPKLKYDFRVTVPGADFKTKSARPAWDVRVPWGHNFTPLADGDLGIVTETERANQKRAIDRVAGSPDPAVLAAYLDAVVVGDQSSTPAPTAIPLSSALMVQGDARRAARNLRYRLGPKRVLGQMGGAPLSALSLSLLDEIWVYHPAFPWPSAGAAFRVVGITPSLSTLRTMLDLWGDRLEDAGQYLLADGGAPILADSGVPLST